MVNPTAEPTSTTMDNYDDEPLSLCLHDAIALGDFEGRWVVPARRRHKKSTTTTTRTATDVDGEDGKSDSIQRMDTDKGGGDESPLLVDDAEDIPFPPHGEVVERLPVLTRILSRSRALAPISTFFPESYPKDDDVINETDPAPETNIGVAKKESRKKKKKTASPSAKKTETPTKSIPPTPAQPQQQRPAPSRDEVLEGAVRTLEDRAALYSVAEGVEVVSCHLAPHVTRKISKLAPLRRTHEYPSVWKGGSAGAGGTSSALDPHHHSLLLGGAGRARPFEQYYYDTADLVQLAQNPNASAKAASITHKSSQSAVPKMEGLDSAESETEETENRQRKPPPPKKRRLASKASKAGDLSSTVAFEDSMEAFATKTLSELAMLVVNYLQDQKTRCHLRDPNPGLGEASKTQQLLVALEDSILAQVRVTTTSDNSISNTTTPAMGSDLGATVASLLHHTTVLSHRHLAAALLWAKVIGQTPALLQFAAVNEPAAIPTLVQGCLSVHPHNSKNTTKEAGHVEAGGASGPKHTDGATSENNQSKGASKTEEEAGNVKRSSFTGGVSSVGVSPGSTIRFAPSSSTGAQPVEIQLAKASIHNLAQLSRRENFRIMNTLRLQRLQSRTSDQWTDLELQLRLLIARQERDRGFPSAGIHLACFILEHGVIQSKTRMAPEKRVNDLICVMLGSCGWKGKSRNKQKAFVVAEVLETLSTSFSSSILLDKDCSCPSHMDLVMRAYLWVLVTTATKLDASSVSLAIAESRICMERLDFLSRRLLEIFSDSHSSTQDSMEEDNFDLLQKSSSWDSLYEMALAANLVRASIEIGQQSAEEENEKMNDLRDQLVGLLKNPPSQCSKAFSLSIAYSLLSEKPNLFQDIVVELVVGNKFDDQRCSVIGWENSNHWIPLCTWSKSTLSLQKFVDGISWWTFPGEDLPLNPSLGWSAFSSGLLALENMETLLKRHLEDQTNAKLRMMDRNMMALIRGTTTYLVDQRGFPLPLILPIQLEQRSTVCLSISASFLLDGQEDEITEEMASFLLQLYHCVLFSSLAPKSPFVLDVNTIPFTQIVVCLTQFRDVAKTPLVQEIMNYIVSLAPESIDRARYLERQKKLRHLARDDFTNVVEKRTDLLDRLRWCMEETQGHGSDHLGEKIYLEAMTTLNDQELLCGAAGALLSKPKSPSMYFTYAKLCEDPLMILKCPMRYWNQQGFRRMALRILGEALIKNKSYLEHSELDEMTILELSATQELLIIRCLLSSVVGGSIELRNCETIIGTVRWILCNRRGLTSALFKQGLSNEAIDWLIEYVPETILDAQEYAVLLSESSTLTPLERLITADGVFRIVVAHGLRHEKTSEQLALLALSQLISSFFLILGPVGVSVSTITTEDVSTDATQIARQATFRILKAASIRSYRVGLRNECIVALQKLHRLCKGEELVGGHPVATGARQKGFVRELLDAISKAVASMGASL